VMHSTRGQFSRPSSFDRGTRTTEADGAEMLGLNKLRDERELRELAADGAVRLGRYELDTTVALAAG
jgi:hypothetical protein